MSVNAFCLHRLDDLKGVFDLLLIHLSLRVEVTAMNTNQVYAKLCKPPGRLFQVASPQTVGWPVDAPKSEALSTAGLGEFSVFNGNEPMLTSDRLVQEPEIDRCAWIEAIRGRGERKPTVA